MAGPIPTKKIPQLTAYGIPLQGTEMLEIWSVNTSRRITARDFVLPIDSLLTFTGQGADLPGSRQVIEGIGIAFIDGGAGSTVSINATGAVAGPANPTALVGLTTVNGAALTYMRSDASPALDQSITPIWTGDHIFAANQNQVRNVLPQWIFVETDAAADNQAWPIRISGEQFTIGALNDLGDTFTPWVSVDRTGTVIDLVNLQGTTIQVNGVNVRDATNLFNTGTVPTARLGSGVADATTWLRGDQTWATLPGGFTGFNNPTATIGLAVVNGVATTAMRSDAAPPLSQTIAPTWTAQHIFSLSGATNAAIFASSAQPQVDWNETDAAANNRRWRLEAQGEQFLGRVVDDANSAAVTWMAVDRTLNAVDSIAFTAGANLFTLSNSQVNTPVQFRSTRSWALNNLLNYGLVVSSANPAIALQEEGVTANNGIWDIAALSEQLLFRTVSDGVVSAVNWMVVDRSSTTVDSVSFPAEVLFTRAAVAGTVNDLSVALSSAAPILGFNETAAAANNRLWEVSAQGEQFLIRAYTDDGLSLGTAVQIDRTGATIDSVVFPTQTSGSFLVGTTASLVGGNVAQFFSPGTNTAILAAQGSTGNDAIGAWNQGTTGNNGFIGFYTEGAPNLRGTINYNRGAGLVAYNTSSDRRRKKNIRDSIEASEIIDAIQVRAFDWKDSDTHLEHWLVAQELHQVYPNAVTPSEEGDWAVDPSKLVPLMIKEIQSLRRRVAAVGA